jgi:L-alanine-DL-glutamate epimerase-like enolase superfamily enzyme
MGVGNAKPKGGTMRIRDIRAIGLSGATPEGGWSAELRPEDSVHTLVVVETDEGLSGVGGVFTNAALVRAALALMRPLWEGETALEPERVSEKLHQHTFWMGRGGSLTHAISGVDVALWDILGQATGQPVGRLLGGRYRERVRPYASILMEAPGPLAERIQGLRAEGFTAVKIGWGPFGRKDAATDEAIVRAAREAIGDGGLLLVDPGASDAFWPQGYAWALRTAAMLEAYGVGWFEEPLPPDALADFVALRRATGVPTAGGETLTRRQSFTPFLVAGAFDVVQPDVTKVGGLSEARRIGWLAGEFGAKLVPHGWNTAAGLAADLQLASALPQTDLVEYIAGSPYVDDLPTAPWALDAEGMLAIPERPGLGLELDWEQVGFYGDEQTRS